jgi:hypothetical protein
MVSPTSALVRATAAIKSAVKPILKPAVKQACVDENAKCPLACPCDCVGDTAADAESTKAYDSDLCNRALNMAAECASLIVIDNLLPDPSKFRFTRPQSTFAHTQWKIMFQLLLGRRISDWPEDENGYLQEPGGSATAIQRRPAERSHSAILCLDHAGDTLMLYPRPNPGVCRRATRPSDLSSVVPLHYNQLVVFTAEHYYVAGLALVFHF